MNKILKIFLIILLVFSFSCICAYATDNETDSTANEPSSSFSTNDYTSISSLNDYSQANLELNNILCVILIAVGVVIILLAIAILIKLKR